MPKTLTFHIHTDTENQSIQQFLRKHLEFSQAQIRSLKFRENGITVNGSRCRIDYILKNEDTLRLALKKKHVFSYLFLFLNRFPFSMKMKMFL